MLYKGVRYYSTIMKAALGSPLCIHTFLCASVIDFALFNHILIPNHSCNNLIWFEFPYQIFIKFFDCYV